LSGLVLKCWIQVKEVPRLNGIITIELVGCAVKLIGSGFGDQVDLTACSFSKLGRVVAGLDLELLENVDRGPKVEQVIELIAINGSIQQKAILLRPRSCDRDAASRPSPISAVACIDTGHQRRQLDEVPSVQRQVHNLLPVHNSPHRGLLAL